METQDFLQSVCYSFGQDPTNQRFVDDFYKSLTFAQQDFCTKRRWGFLRSSGSVTTEESSRTADLPSDFRMLYASNGSVRFSSPSDVVGGELTVITEQQFRQTYYDSDEEGTPNYCWLFGTTMSFSPIPDDEYVINIIYYKRPTEITDAQVELTVPEEFHEAIMHMLRRRLQALGYASVMEITISDTELTRLIGQFAKEDIGRYGGMEVNLPPLDYTIETV